MPTLKQLYHAWIPSNKSRSKQSLIAILSKGSRHKTHWRGCWEVHACCAKKALEKLEKEK